MSVTLCTVLVGSRERSIRLPATLWPELLIGERLIVESDAGEWMAAFVELGADLAPLLRLPFLLDAGALCRIRRPRTA